MNHSDSQPEDFQVGDYLPGNLPQFMPGQIVCHKRYHYRGVVVDFDMRCQAPDDWYVSNKTQPSRDQPWYHLLVDGANATTYAAEEYLQLEDISDFSPIRHPLLTKFFGKWNKTHYPRNDRHWPNW